MCIRDSVDITSETPLWAVMMYGARPNILEIKNLFDQWRKDNPNVKNEHTQNYKKLYSYVIEHRALDEEGFIDASAFEDHVAAELTLIENRKKFAVRKSKLKNTSHADWQPLGPFRMEENDGLPVNRHINCLLYTSPSPRDATLSRMPSSA